MQLEGSCHCGAGPRPDVALGLAAGGRRWRQCSKSRFIQSSSTIGSNSGFGSSA